MRPARKRTKRMKEMRKTMPGRSWRCWIRAMRMKMKTRVREAVAML